MRGTLKKHIPTAALTLLAAVATLSCTHHPKAPMSDRDRQKATALNSDLKNGLITQAEYDAKVSQMAEAKPPAETSSAAPPEKPDENGGVKMKIVAIWDPVFNMPAFKMSVPADWSFEGLVLRASACNPNMPSVVYRASSPDGLTGVQKLPRYDWGWAEDPFLTRVMRSQHCEVKQPMKAEEFARATMLPQARPDAAVQATEADPGAEKFQAQINRMNEQLAAGSRNGQQPFHQSGDSVQLRLAYNYNGRPVEEWLTVTETAMDQPTPAMNGVVHRYQSQATATGMRAPQGQLEASTKLLTAIRDSIQPIPEWQQRQQEAIARQNAQFSAMMQRQQQASSQMLRQQGERFSQQMQQQHQAFMGQMEQQRQARNEQFQEHMAEKDRNTAAFNAQMDARSRHTADYTDTLLDQQRFSNPATGTVTTQSNQYNHTWEDGNGNILQTDSHTFDPNAQLPGSWTELQPIKH